MPRIILLEPLTHGSTRYPPGTSLDLETVGMTDRDAAWLVGIGVAVEDDSEPNADGREGEPGDVTEPPLPNVPAPDAPTPSIETEEEPQ